MRIEHNEVYKMILTDKDYKRKFLAMFIKIIPVTPYKVSRMMLRSYRNEYIITMSEYAMLIKWNNLTHGEWCYL